MTSPPTPQPKGLPYIVANEAAERFSYYGMKGILVVFMTTYLVNARGTLDVMSEKEAALWYHLFAMGNYFFPMIGGIVSDVWLGKYRTIIALSLVYCAGHAALALDSTRGGLALGLTLVAIGAGGVKPCVSAHLGDQYGDEPSETVSKGFSLFYLAINIGAALAILIIPWVLEHYGAEVAFAIPGILMGVATFVFWLGRSTFRTVPPLGYTAYWERLKCRETQHALLGLLGFFAVLSIFWSLFDQIGSSWVLQAKKMDTAVVLPFLGSVEILPAQLQAANPLLVIAFVPLLTWIGYPWLGRVVTLTPVRIMSAGMILAALSFVVVAHAENRILDGNRPTILWQVAAYVLITLAEVAVSITSLQFAYVRAPHGVKSLVMGLYFLSVSLGNGVTALTNFLLLDGSFLGALDGAGYFLFFAALSALAGIALFVCFSPQGTRGPSRCLES